MLEIKGKYNVAKVFTHELEAQAIAQLRTLCDQEFMSGITLRVMPDAHAGKGCVVGTTMTVNNRVVPNLVGVDIGCGMEVVKIGRCSMDFPLLDKVIRHNVPVGKGARKTPHEYADKARLRELSCLDAINQDKACKSIGTLGSGNHFIEIGRDAESGDDYLIIHSGSRHAGLQVATFHQKLATVQSPAGSRPDLAYLEGDDFDNYVADMKIMQEYAHLNRKAIAAEILHAMGWSSVESFSTIHNYLDTESMILRKGAVSAREGEKLLIPMNMRDGSLLCVGLGNADWNFSAPHGAGRLYSRTAAKKNLDFSQFKKEMAGIYSSCVCNNALDESPSAYKPMRSILEHIGPTVKVMTVLKTVYNFKAV